MKNLSIFIFFFFFFLLHHISIVTSTPPYTPVENILVDCGSSRNSTASDKRNWAGDRLEFAPIEPSNNRSVTSTDVYQGSSVESVPYLTARISRSEFTYKFLVTPGQKFIRLYFYPASYPNFDRSKAFFTVKAGSFTLLKNFSASLTADYLEVESFFKEFCLNVEENQNLNVSFIPSDSSNEAYAFINGIEIVSMPTKLYYTPPGPEGPGLLFIDEHYPGYYVDNDTALETVYRLNVGSKSISPMDDTGMFRSWSDDINYLSTPSFIIQNLDIQLKYSKIPAYTAPDIVYQTARSMGNNSAENLLHNLTWRLPVDSGFRYMVRLHFCEFYPQIKEVSDRQFIIYIDNQTAEGAADVIQWSGGNGIPVYMDYVVRIEGNGTIKGLNANLFIAVHPRRAYTAYTDAILNGIEVFKLSGFDYNLAGPNPEPSDTTPAPVQPSVRISTKSKTRKTLLLVAGVSVMGLLIILSSVCCLVFWRFRKKRHSTPYYGQSRRWGWLDPYKGKSSRTKASLSLPEELCRHFSLAEIKAATNNFHEDLIIGTGGFGNVYKGRMNDGDMVVAIKRLNPESKQGAAEFRTEIEMLSHLRHVNLVSLIGYCNDDQEMILVYDFMINGTLRDHLYDTDNDPLSWKQRLEICRGAAIGLHYLHAGLKHPIIHRDVKTTNILLDEKWEAKVSDFGLSKWAPKPAIDTMVKGTFGYLDPEYARGHPLTEKSDVYSFGVVLFEVLCARKVVNKKLEEDQISLANWALKCIDNGTFYQIIDPYLMGKIAPECFKIFLEIARSCVHAEGIKRLTMNDVMEKLSFALELQENADAEKERINAGGKYAYPEISFPVPPHNNPDSGSDSDSSSFSGLTKIGTDITGPSFSTLNFDNTTLGTDSETERSFLSLESDNTTTLWSTNSIIQARLRI